MTSTIPLGSYLFKRIKSIGVDKIWGVPGDYNLQTLDYLYPEGLEWVGTCNELNAGYACDGYARTAGVPGVFVTTYAVGELSALNAVSGACAENVPIIHIVGTSARFFQDNHAVIHHAPAPRGLQPNDHKVYAQLHDPFVCASEYIYHPQDAPQQIDRVLSKVLQTKMPGVLFLPIDMPSLPVDAELLKTPLDPQWPVHPDTDTVADAIVEAFTNSKNPAIIADVFSLRFKLQQTIVNLLSKTSSMGFTTILGKGAIDETHAQFYGVYNGARSEANIGELVEQQADFVLDVGPLESDSNTGGFSRNLDPKKHIQVHSLYSKVFGKEYNGVFFGHVLERVLEKLASTDRVLDTAKPTATQPKLTGPLSQAQLPTLVSKLLNKGDTLVAETGTFQFTARTVPLPSEASFFTQIFYSCIGFALPAAVGAGVAVQQLSPGNKVVLVEGDGSAQMTVQELGTLVRHQLPVIVIIINNEGYAIERAIWGPEQSYNDICPNWKWTKLFDVFGDSNAKTWQIKTAEEFLELASSEEFRNSTKPQLVEIMLPKYEYPQSLVDTINDSRPKQQQLAVAYHKKHDLDGPNLSMSAN